MNSMKSVNWNTGKNILLKAERGVSFEEVLSAMAHGGLLDIRDHPNKDQYPNQRLLVVRIRGYAYLVPFVESESEIFLNTCPRIPLLRAAHKVRRVPRQPCAKRGSSGRFGF